MRALFIVSRYVQKFTISFGTRAPSLPLLKIRLPFRNKASSHKEMKKKEKIPNPTAERLVLYSRSLASLMENGEFVISSEKLAGLCHVNPAQVRKDLSYFGEFGVRGVGYRVRDLLAAR